MAGQRTISGTLNITLWVVQAVLASIFTWAGLMKLFQPDELPFLWVKDNPRLVPIAGIVDLLAAIGIVLPALFRIRAVLTVYAAYGIIALMMAACIFHISRGEAHDIDFNLVVAGLAAFIARGRR